MNRSNGFTLIELMITVALAAIIMTLAVPSFQETIRNNRLTTQANEFVSALNLTRSEAIKRGARITVCKSNDEANCSTAVSWSDGWIIFTDEASFGTLNGNDTLIRGWPGLKGGNTLTVGGNFSNYLSYLGSGESRGSPGNNDTFTLCDNKTKKGRQIFISITGRIRTGESPCP